MTTALCDVPVDKLCHSYWNSRCSPDCMNSVLERGSGRATVWCSRTRTTSSTHAIMVTTRLPSRRQGLRPQSLEVCEAAVGHPGAKRQCAEAMRAEGCVPSPPAWLGYHAEPSFSVVVSCRASAHRFYCALVPDRCAELRRRVSRCPAWRLPEWTTRRPGRQLLLLSASV
jgi:hypothetical protein